MPQLPNPPPDCIWDKPDLFKNTLLPTFSQSLVNADFFTSGIDIDILIKVFEDYIYIP